MTNRWLILFRISDQHTVYIRHDGHFTSDGRRMILVKYPLSPNNGHVEYGVQAFYESTGHVSRFEHTWFPFDGEVFDSATAHPVLLKLDTTKFASFWKTFDKSLSQSERNFRQNMIKFGTVMFMVVSMKLGRGLWDSQGMRQTVLSKIQSMSKIQTATKRFVREASSFEVECNVDTDVSFPRRGSADVPKPKGFIDRLDPGVNRYIGDAISFNYLKGTEYPATFNQGWTVLDYNDIYDGKTYTFYKGTKVQFQRPLLTLCAGKSLYILDFMIQLDHSQTQFMSNYFSIYRNGLSIAEEKFCKKIHS